jgi:hypothetical protein
VFDDDKEDNSPNVSWWLAIPILIVAVGLIWLIAPYISSMPNVKESMEKQLQSVKLMTTVGGAIYAVCLLKIPRLNWLSRCLLIIVDILTLVVVWRFGELYYYGGEFRVPYWLKYGPAGVNFFALFLAIGYGRRNEGIGPLR